MSAVENCQKIYKILQNMPTVTDRTCASCLAPVQCDISFLYAHASLSSDYIDSMLRVQGLALFFAALQLWASVRSQPSAAPAPEIPALSKETRRVEGCIEQWKSVAWKSARASPSHRLLPPFSTVAVCTPLTVLILPNATQPLPGESPVYSAYLAGDGNVLPAISTQ